MSKSPASIIYDSSGTNPVGVVLDGAVYRLQAQTKVVRASDGAQINPATEDTLALIKSTDGIKKIVDSLPTGTNEIGKVAQGTKAAGSAAWPIVPYDASGNAFLGQKVMASSIPVTIASDQINIPNLPDVTGTITALNGTVQMSVSGYPGVAIVLTGTWVATLVFELSSDGGTTWVTSSFGVPIGSYVVPIPQVSTSVTSNGTYRGLGVSTSTHVRVKASAYTSGTVNVRIVASINPVQNTLTSILQNVIVSTGNSTTANLASGATFTGVSESSLGVSAIKFSFIASQNCTVYLQQSNNGTDWDISDSFFTDGGSPLGRTTQVVSSYYRVLVTNNGGSTTTYLRLQTSLCPVASVLPRALGRLNMSESLSVVMANNHAALLVTQINLQAIPVTVGFDRTDNFEAAAAGLFYIGARYQVATGYKFTCTQYNAWSADNRVAVRVASLTVFGTWNPNTGVFTSTGSYTYPAFGSSIELCITSAMGSLNDQAITISYTNHLGVSGRTASAVGGLKLKKGVTAKYKMLFTLQEGDVGVISVQSVTADAPNTGAIEVRGVIEFYYYDLTQASTNYVLTASAIPTVVTEGGILAIDYSSSVGVTVRRYMKCMGVLEALDA